MLLSKQLANNVNSVFIDEDGQYDLHSDHVIISTCLCNTDTKETKTMSTSKDRLFWKITDDTDWDSFQNYLESSLLLIGLIKIMILTLYGVTNRNQTERVSK